MGGNVIYHEADQIRDEGFQEGKLETYFELVYDGTFSITDAAERLNLPEEEFLDEYKIWKVKK